MNSPAYRRPLNDKQLDILHFLYRFRFITSPLIAQTLKIKPSKAHERLTVLFDQSYIGRRYDKTYKWQGKAATYFLLPKGTDALASMNDERFVPNVLARLQKDESRSERFINHWLNLFDIHNQLKSSIGPRLRFFTTTQLAPYPAFIRPLPDVFIRLWDENGENEVQFFLDLIDTATPKFAGIGRIRQYVDYAEDGGWQDATKVPLPSTILACENPRLVKRLKAIAAEELEYSYADEDLQFIVTTLEKLKLKPSAILNSDPNKWDPNGR